LRTVALLELERIGRSQIAMAAHRPDPAAFGQNDGDRFALDHRLQRDVPCGSGFLHQCTAVAKGRVGAVALAQRGNVALQLGPLALRAFDQLLQIFLLRHQIGMFAAQFHLFQLAQRPQAHVENGFGLPVGQGKFVHHHELWLILRTDDLDHPIKVEIGDDIAIKQFEPIGDLGKAMLRASDQHVDLVLEPFDQHRTQPQNARRMGGVQHVQVERKAVFQIGQPIETVLEHLRIDIAVPGRDDDTDRLIAFIAHIFQDRQLLVVDQGRDLLDQLALLHLIGNFADDQLPGAAAQFLYAGRFPDALIILAGRKARTGAERAAPRGIGFRNDCGTIHQHAASGEVRPLHHCHQRRMIRIGIVDQQAGGIEYFGHIMRRYAGRHAHCNAAGAIGKQVGEKAGEYLRLFILAIIGRAKIDRAFVQPRHQVGGRLGQARFGIAHRGGIIAVDIAKIALPVDQWRAQDEILRQPHHGVIHAAVAMGVIFADDVAHDAGAFLVACAVAGRVGDQHVGRRAGRLHPEQPHRPEQAAMHRLQPVAQIRQGPRGNGGQGIDEITLRQRRVERMVLDIVERIAKIGHRRWLSRRMRGTERELRWIRSPSKGYRARA